MGSEGSFGGIYSPSCSFPVDTKHSLGTSVSMALLADSYRPRRSASSFGPGNTFPPPFFPPPVRPHDLAKKQRPSPGASTTYLRYARSQVCVIFWAGKHPSPTHFPAFRNASWPRKKMKRPSPGVHTNFIRYVRPLARSPVEAVDGHLAPLLNVSCPLDDGLPVCAQKKQVRIERARGACVPACVWGGDG